MKSPNIAAYAMVALLVIASLPGNASAADTDRAEGHRVEGRPCSVVWTRQR